MLVMREISANSAKIYGETKSVDLYFVSRTTTQEDAYKIFDPFLAAFKNAIKVN